MPEFILAKATPPTIAEKDLATISVLFGLEQTQLAIPLSATPPPVTGQLWPLAAG